MRNGFTVLMAVYKNDDPDLFIRAVRSVFDNTLKPIELLLVVDGPVPAKIDLAIEMILSDRCPLKILRLQENLGFAEALNAGMKLVKTSWIVRADADDYNLPNRFAALAECLERYPDLSIVGSNILEVEKSGTPIAVRQVPMSDIEIKRMLPTRNPFNHMSVAFNVDAVRRLGGYPNIYLKEDYALWSKLLRDHKAYNLQDVLVYATGGKNMYKRRGGFKYVASEYRLQKFLVNTGCKSLLLGTLNFIQRSLVFIMPSKMRGVLYKQFLRKPAGKFL